jgi:hypothetical protein
MALIWVFLPHVFQRINVAVIDILKRSLREGRVQTLAVFPFAYSAINLNKPNKRLSYWKGTCVEDVTNRSGYKWNYGIGQFKFWTAFAS